MEFVGTVKEDSPSGNVSRDVPTGNQQRKLKGGENDCCKTAIQVCYRS
jgi:hypothetical protein